MQTIFKYPFEIQDSFKIKMPRGAKILDVQVQNGVACIWAIVDPENKPTEHQFYLYGTGHPFKGGKYIGTFQFDNNLVFHLFN